MKCKECGKFCKPYGIVPEEEYFCEDCVNRRLENPENMVTDYWWVKPNHVSVAKSINKPVEDEW